MGRWEKEGKTGDYYWIMDSRMREILLKIMSLMELNGDCRFDSKKVRPDHGITYRHSRHLKEKGVWIH